MKLTLKRIYKGEKYTIGKLYIDGEYFCDTIEDVIRPLPLLCPDTPHDKSCKCKEKIYAETAIPCGTYRLALSYSPKFKRNLPRLYDVPHFLGILIHSGNTEKDSAGCIIVGKNKVKGKVIDSKITMEALMKRLENQKNITIEIV